MRRRKKKRMETSKVLAIVILAVALFDIQIIILAPYFDKVAPESIAVALVTEVVGVFVTYCAKAFMSKKQEENIRLKEGKSYDD